MQGDSDDEVVRWFGMFRSVGFGRLDDARYETFRREQRRRVRNAGLTAAALATSWILSVVWHLPGVVSTLLIAPMVNALWPAGASLRRLFAVRPDHHVEFFEGRIPQVQGFRDALTNKLVRHKLMDIKRVHRLTVHVATGGYRC